MSLEKLLKVLEERDIGPEGLELIQEISKIKKDASLTTAKIRHLEELNNEFQQKLLDSAKKIEILKSKLATSMEEINLLKNEISKKYKQFETITVDSKQRTEKMAAEILDLKEIIGNHKTEA